MSHKLACNVFGSYLGGFRTTVLQIQGQNVGHACDVLIWDKRCCLSLWDACSQNQRDSREIATAATTGLQVQPNPGTWFSEVAAPQHSW